MSIATRLVIDGNVANISTREVTVKATGEKLTFTNVLVVGPNCLADCTLGNDVAVPEMGKRIQAQVEVGVYRDDDQIRLVKYLA